MISGQEDNGILGISEKVSKKLFGRGEWKPSKLRMKEVNEKNDRADRFLKIKKRQLSCRCGIVQKPLKAKGHSPGETIS